MQLQNGGLYFFIHFLNLLNGNKSVYSAYFGRVGLSPLVNSFDAEFL